MLVAAVWAGATLALALLGNNDRPQHVLAIVVTVGLVLPIQQGYGDLRARRAAANS